MPSSRTRARDNPYTRPDPQVLVSGLGISPASAGRADPD